MQDRPLLISSLIEYANQYHGDVELVSRSVEGPIHRYTYADAYKRSKQVANALAGFGVKEGDRIGTLAWNTYRHFELYYGISGMGAVLHTINPRLFPDQITYIANHAEDRFIFTDLTFVPLLEQIADKLTSVEGYVVMTDEANMPDTSLPNAVCYETLIGKQSADFDWPALDESAASSLCYTSGTTGNPKGVMYSHRSTVLHSFAVCTIDGIGMSSHEVVMPVVPMFHANAWGTIYAGAMCGAKMVFPGAGMDGPSIYQLLDEEKVSLTLAVPTVWLGLLQHLRAESNKKLPYMQRVVIGGSAAPQSMIEAFEKDYDVQVIHAWGMTEMSPLGTTGNMRAKHAGRPYDEQIAVKVKQGRALYGVDLKIVDDDGNELPRDGVAFGRLLVRGPWITTAISRARAAMCSTPIAGSIPAMSRPWTRTAICRSPTGPRT